MVKSRNVDGPMRSARYRVLGSCALLLLCSALALAPARAGEGAQAGPASASPAEASSGTGNSRQQARADESTTPGLVLEVKTGKERVYLREPVFLTVTLLAGPETPRNIEYPRLKGTGFLVGEFALPRQVSVTREGRDLSAYEFTTTVTPTRSGALQIGPAELGCEMLAPAAGPAAFFGGTEARRVTARSTAIPLTVLPLPVRGRPAGFSGAVGRFKLARTVRPTRVLAGDPATVRTVIRGVGNAEAFSCNSVSGPGLRSYPPRSELRGSTLICEQVVIPESPAVWDLPAVVISYFDPQTGRYRSASGAPLTLRASPAPPASLPVLPRPAPTAPPAASSQAAYSSHLLIAFLLLAVGLAGYRLARGLWRQVPPRAAAESASVRAIRGHLAAAEAALAAGAVDIFYTSVFRALQADLAMRLGVPAAGITASLATHLLPAGIPPGISMALTKCDLVRYGKYSPDRAEMNSDLSALREFIATF